MLTVKIYERKVGKKGMAGKMLFSLKRTWQNGFGLQSCTWIYHNTPRKMCFGWKSPKWRRWIAYQHKHLIPTVKHSGGGGCKVNSVTLQPLSRPWVLCIPKYSRVKYESMCLTANAWLKIGPWNRTTIPSTANIRKRKEKYCPVTYNLIKMQLAAFSLA